MGTLDEVTSMKREGRTDADINSALKRKGISDNEIAGAMSQSKIKDAVHDEYQPAQRTQEDSMADANATTQEYGEMSPSLMSPGYEQQPEPEQQLEAPEAPQEAPQAYASYGQQSEYATPQYSSGLGSDVITEIADQVVSEKLNPLLSAMDKILDMKSNVDSHIKYLDERLQRIEKIIDRLQLSVLQRVGEYVSNVEDIKQEMQETQKTFRSVIDRK